MGSLYVLGGLLISRFGGPFREMRKSDFVPYLSVPEVRPRSAPKCAHSSTAGHVSALGFTTVSWKLTPLPFLNVLALGSPVAWGHTLCSEPF